MHTECAMPTTARIAITVTEFHEIGDRKGPTRANVKLITTGNGKVSQGRANDPIDVYGLVYLEFCVETGHGGDRYAYSPVGISFRETPCATAGKDRRRKAGELRDPLGRAAFPLRTFVSRGDTSELVLLDTNPEPGEFKYDLVIQRSDGVTGIIDPPIRNRGILR